MSKFGKAVDEQVKYTGLNMFKALLGGMAFGAMLMGLLLLPSNGMPRLSLNVELKLFITLSNPIHLTPFKKHST